MDIIQSFYDNLSSRYERLFSDWHSTVREQAALLHALFREKGFDVPAKVLDCACGIGTQAIGLASLGYSVTASDISGRELEEAERRAADLSAVLRFRRADFRALSEVFPGHFDIVICMDNALPHMLSESELDTAVRSITDRLTAGGLFVASIRDYDALLGEKPPYSPPYIHRTPRGQRVCFQTWSWEGERYRLTQYIIEDEDSLQISKFDCEYRATRRKELTELLLRHGCHDVEWSFPEETGFYQPVVLAKKR